MLIKDWEVDMTWITCFMIILHLYGFYSVSSISTKCMGLTKLPVIGLFLGHFWFVHAIFTGYC